MSQPITISRPLVFPHEGLNSLPEHRECAVPLAVKLSKWESTYTNDFADSHKPNLSVPSGRKHFTKYSLSLTKPNGKVNSLEETNRSTSNTFLLWLVEKCFSISHLFIKDLNMTTGMTGMKIFFKPIIFKIISKINYCDKRESWRKVILYMVIYLSTPG